MPTFSKIGNSISALKISCLFPPLLKLVADQLKVSVESWDEYGQREQTRREHLVELLEGDRRVGRDAYARALEGPVARAQPILGVEYDAARETFAEHVAEPNALPEGGDCWFENVWAEYRVAAIFQKNPSEEGLPYKG